MRILWKHGKVKVGHITRNFPLEFGENLDQWTPQKKSKLTLTQTARTACWRPCCYQRYPTMSCVDQYFALIWVRSILVRSRYGRTFSEPILRSILCVGSLDEQVLKPILAESSSPKPIWIELGVEFTVERGPCGNCSVYPGVIKEMFGHTIAYIPGIENPHCYTLLSWTGSGFTF